MLAGLVAHFTAMKEAPTEHLPKQLKPITEQLQTEYDMKNHSSEKGEHLELIDDEFIEWFSIAGPPQKCIDRLGELIEMGLDYVYLLGGSPVPEPRNMRLRAMVDQTEIFAKEVLPSFK
jgi:alkanesulfonate monooxygenase SsuD/methylene tetrahydromethanopterin reductase-like flavin-dependent oxidoreductase (luciferase family)